MPLKVGVVIIQLLTTHRPTWTKPLLLNGLKNNVAREAQGTGPESNAVIRDLADGKNPRMAQVILDAPNRPKTLSSIEKVFTAFSNYARDPEGFRKLYPDKYLDLGIAEQNTIGIASGLASEGFQVITTTFAPFQTARCCEQIKVNLGYMKQKVCMVGLASGLVLGTLGYTHCSIEDIGILRSIPNIQIVSPADSTETVKAVQAALKSKKSTYIRLTGSSNNPAVYKSDYKFTIGKSIKLKEVL